MVGSPLRALCFLACLLTVACAKSWGIFWETTPTFSAFGIAGETGKFEGNTIQVDIPWSALTNLTATFSTTASEVLVQGIVQKSGMTKNDFTNPVQYLLKTSGGLTNTYTVTALNTYPIADTGQSGCSTGGGALGACPDGATPGQDGETTNVPAARSFTGPAANPGYANDLIIKDNVTKLTWRSCQIGRSDSSCATGSTTNVNWTTQNANCANLNSLNGGAGYAGLTNWRLPTAHELRTIHHYTTAGIDPAFVGYQDADKWTSTSVSGGGNHVRIRSVATWSLGHDEAADANSHSAYCVAASSYAYAPSYVDNGDGTITDKSTKLRWQRCPMGLSGNSCASGTISSVIWNTAMPNNCNSLVLGPSGTQWRMPSAAELHTLLLYEPSPHINATFFPNAFAGTGNYHSSTTRVGGTADAYYVNFTVATLQAGIKTGGGSEIRCVASAP